mgnify:CR=1 FL=1
MANLKQEIIEFVKDYMTRYKTIVTLNELKDDYMIQYEDTDYGSLEYFSSVWNKLREEKLIVMVPRSRPGQDSEYKWNG